ncbi:MAG: LURP-one-related family protein [Atopobiaceae bacterium]|nr:LURP-one-related family protein [Atopobiaceae bacterium]
MGVFSKRMRYREEGEQANVYNVESFGDPARSLFLSTDVIKIGMKTDITDSDGNVVYHSQRKTVSIHDKTEVVDSEGKPVAHIEKVIPSVRDLYLVTLDDGMSFEFASELLHVVNVVYNISELGWQLRGRLAAWNFQIYDEDGQVIAVISEKAVSIHDKYCIDIYRTEQEGTVIAILVALQHAIRNRKKRARISASRI